MSSQPQVAKLAPDLVKGVTSLARTFVAASRNWTLYPADHPAVRAPFERLAEAIQNATDDAAFSVGVTPDNLMIESFAMPANAQVLEAAKLLHDRDLLRLTFSGRDDPADATRVVQGFTCARKRRAARGAFSREYMGARHAWRVPARGCRGNRSRLDANRSADVVMRSSPFTVRRSPLDERSTEDGKR